MNKGDSADFAHF